jgi:hypothetical protein
MRTEYHVRKSRLPKNVRGEGVTGNSAAYPRANQNPEPTPEVSLTTGPARRMSSDG